MSELQKTIISFILFILWSVGCFLGGYLFCNRQAIKRINESNQQLEEKQREYDRIIAETRDRLSQYREQLHQQVSNNGATTTELSKLVEQIRKQKLNI